MDFPRRLNSVTEAPCVSNLILQAPLSMVISAADRARARNGIAQLILFILFPFRCPFKNGVLKLEVYFSFLLCKSFFSMQQFLTEKRVPEGGVIAQRISSVLSNPGGSNIFLTSRFSATRTVLFSLWYPPPDSGCRLAEARRYDRRSRGNLLCRYAGKQWDLYCV